MGLAEDASKVHRIAAGNAAPLRRLYRAAVARASSWRAALSPGAAAWTQNADAGARVELLSVLPPGLQRQLAAAAGLSAVAPPAAAIARAIAATAAPEQVVRAALRATVRASSRRQAMAGLLSTGLGSAARYVTAKVLKAWRSKA
jgi:hypothetical protein